MSDPSHRTSKLLSLVLRHNPGAIGVQLDAGGWADLDELVACADRSGNKISRELILQVVAESDKQRFALSADGRRIRANQGHSINVDLGLVQTEPPEVLFHGTAVRFLDSIFASGLNAATRQHVHLSADVETALRVGRRHGSPAVLRVDSRGLHVAGQAFFRSENGVWLTSQISPQFLALHQSQPE
jgi:putative RNA 2'-phosphotransferase